MRYRIATAKLVLCLSLLGLAQGPAGNRNSFYREVTEQHLPVQDLLGFSMDVRAADLDGDHDLDLIVAQEFRPNILLLNDGTGMFTNESSRLPRIAHDHEDIGIADIDLDGDLDIVVVSEDDEVNELYLNDGGAKFSDESGRLPVTGISNAVEMSDVDSDGDPDILIGNNGQNTLLLNDGRGFFSDATQARLPLRDDITQDLELGDVDGDGDVDILVANEDANTLLLNDSRGFFTDEGAARLALRPSPEETRDASLADVDGDGDLDIVFANVRLFMRDANPQNRLLLNDGHGVFSDETTTRLPVDQDSSMDSLLVDVDKDGDIDLLTANFGDLSGQRATTPYRVYLNRGAGHFDEATETVFPPGVVGNGLAIEPGDFNLDGLDDLYLASRGGTDRLLLAQRP